MTDDSFQRLAKDMLDELRHTGSPYPPNVAEFRRRYQELLRRPERSFRASWERVHRHG